MFRAKSVEPVSGVDADERPIAASGRRDRQWFGRRGREDVGRRDRDDVGRSDRRGGGRRDRRGLLATREPRRPVRGRAGASLALGAGWLARGVRLLAGVVALIIAVGILLVVLDANPNNGIASAVHDAGRWLVGPFDGLFSFHSAKVALAVNWGIAAVVYLALAALIVRLLRRPHRQPTRGSRRPPDQRGFRT